jgi:hypothetical protein
MVLKPIYKPEFFDENRTLRLHSKIPPHKALNLECTFKKASEAWRVSVSIICTIAENQKNPPINFTCQLPPIDLQPMDTKVIGAWNSIFWKEDYWPLPLLTQEGKSAQLNPEEALDELANQDLLVITVYKNGFTVKSEYLQLETNQ